MNKNFNTTINLPQIAFPMKGNLKNLEPRIIKKWKNLNLYKLIKKERNKKKIFIIHDGPPYANGNIHLGHTLNKILKDIIIKSKIFMNMNVSYYLGWDCHGLPIELEIQKKYNTFNIKNNKFRKLCYKYAKQQIKKQKKEFYRLGILTNWNKHYETMNYKTIANTIKIINKLIKLKLIKRKKKPTNWCIQCKSSIADSEIEYQKIKSKSLYITFVVQNKNNFLQNIGCNNNNFFENKSIEFIVWTTTPWSIPGNCAIALHPKFIYALYQTKKNRVLVVLQNKKKFLTKIFRKITELHCFQGYQIKNVFVNHPISQIKIPIIIHNYIKKDKGTGITHIASEHGQEDYNISQQYNLKGINLINSQGKYNDYLYIPKIKGVNIKKATKYIIQELKNNRTLLFIKNIPHKYPYCWRHKKKIIIRSTSQWFINIHKIKKNILNNIKKIKWIPEWGYNKIKKMIIDRQEWCISRQRSWGTPLPLLIHKKTKKIHPKINTILKKIIKKIKKKGPNFWFKIKLSKLIKDYKNYKKVTDILDVWFDSGSTCFSIMNPKFLKNKKSNLYLEGSDQYRGWFMSSIIINTAINNGIPCKKIITHGFVVDGEGNKMSKSLGNVIKPNSIINKFGADILRLWIASTEYHNEINISNEIINRTIDSYRKIRNTMKFLISNLENFDNIKDFIKFNNMILLDKWIIYQAYKTQKKIVSLYKKYKFCQITKEIINFCNKKLSNLYISIIKDRKYIIKKNTLPFYSAQTTIWILVQIITRWIAPIISFTAEEIWEYIPQKNKTKSIFIEKWYNNFPNNYENNVTNYKVWKILMFVKKKINKIIEKKKKKQVIFSSLESKITLYVTKKTFHKIKIFQHELKYFFIISDFILKQHKKNNFVIKFKKINSIKCNRCWHYVKNISPKHHICSRCIINIYGKGEKRLFF